MNPLPTRLVRCGIYTRQSRQRPEDFASCDAQFQACLDFTQERGWLWTGERYDDSGASGDSLTRPALARLRADLATGKIDRVVIHRLDRLSRKLSDCVGLLQEFRDAGIGLSVVTEPHLGTSAEHVLFLNVMAAFAEFEHDMICGRLADARAALKRQGRRVAGCVPFGYVADPLTKQLEIEPAEARCVRFFFEWAAAGKTAREISDLANRAGWRTKVSVSVRSSNKRGGGRWTPRQVLETLANPTYAGLIRDGDQVRPGCHVAIVPIDRYQEVQKQVAARRTHSSPREKSAERWPLQGLLVCGQCERPMGPSISWHGPRGYRYYRCRSSAGGSPPCRGVCIQAHEIESFVQREVAAELDGAGPDWGRLTFAAQGEALARLVGRVVFTPREATIQIGYRQNAVASTSAFHFVQL